MRTITCADSCYHCRRKLLCPNFGEEGYECDRYKRVEIREDGDDEFGWKKINYDLI